MILDLFIKIVLKVCCLFTCFYLNEVSYLVNILRTHFWLVYKCIGVTNKYQKLHKITPKTIKGQRPPQGLEEGLRWLKLNILFENHMYFFYISWQLNHMTHHFILFLDVGCNNKAKAFHQISLFLNMLGHVSELLNQRKNLNLKDPNYLQFFATNSYLTKIKQLRKENCVVSIIYCA